MLVEKEQNKVTPKQQETMNIHPQPQAHVVIFPLPAQGPINCMLNLTDLILSLTPTTVFVTFITTVSVARRLSRLSHAGARHRFGSRFRLETVTEPVELSDDNPHRSQIQICDLTEFLAAEALDAGSRLRELLVHGGSLEQSPSEKRRPPVSCIVADGLFGFMVDVAKEIRVPLVYFETISPAALWTYLCLPKMLQFGDLPFQGDDLDEQITSIRGMEGYLRRRDLPGFCRSYAPNNQVIELILKQAQCFPRAQGHILNTFDDLEAPILSHIRDLCPNLYTIGPLHSHRRTRVQPCKLKNESSNSLWEEDRSCLAWLDAQPLKSVLFVSVGSLVVMTTHQLMELWHGLVGSKFRFLWVRRSGSVNELDQDQDDGTHLEVSEELKEGTKERGRVVSWVPQEKVLAHQAIGGFLTHCGWNSTLESIVEGVPMICWPFFVDQQVNSRLVSEVWGVGLDMKDSCDRVIVEKMVRELMGEQREKFAAKVDKLAKLATKGVGEGGTSYNNLDRLIDDIQFNRFSIPSNADI